VSGADWAHAQLVCLERMHGHLTPAALTVEVNQRGPAHSERALWQFASRQGISLAPRRRYDPWDEEQQQIIRDYAGLLTTAEIAAEIRRQTCWIRTADAVERRARKLDVSLYRSWYSIRDLGRILPLRRGRLASLIGRSLAPDRVYATEGSGRQSAVGLGVVGRSVAPDRQCATEARGPWRLSVAAVEAFIREHAYLFDWRDVRGKRWQEVARQASLRETWLSVSQVAVGLGLDERSVRWLAAAGQLAGAVRFGRRWRIPAAAVGEMLRKRREQALAS
jgi:excisionase family DNA binding protein